MNTAVPEPSVLFSSLSFRLDFLLFFPESLSMVVVVVVVVVIVVVIVVLIVVFVVTHTFLPSSLSRRVWVPIRSEFVTKDGYTFPPG